MERLVASLFRSFGFEFSRTSRAESKLLDNCGIDITNVPFLIQCKAGYERNPPKYRDIYKYIKENLNKNFPKEHDIHNTPIVLIHKGDGRKKENFTWTFDNETITNILKEYYFFKNEYTNKNKDSRTDA